MHYQQMGYPPHSPLPTPVNKKKFCEKGQPLLPSVFLCCRVRRLAVVCMSNRLGGSMIVDLFIVVAVVLGVILFT